MFNRHKHQWTEVERKFYPGRTLTSVKNVQPDYLDLITLGRTIVSLKCECGRYDQQTLLGRVEK